MPTTAINAARLPLAAALLFGTIPAQGAQPALRPIQVYVLAGQSNMLEMGDVRGRNWRHSGFYASAAPDAKKGVAVAAYPGAYDASKDYGALTPDAQKTVIYDGMGRDPFPAVDGPATYVARGFLEVEKTGTYALSPGYAGSTYNVTSVAGREIYRREPGEDPSQVPIRLEGGKRYPFQTTFFTKAADGLFWLGRTDIPGTLDTVVRQEKKFPYLLGPDGKWAKRADVFFKDARLHGGWNWDPKDRNAMRLDEARHNTPARPLTVGKGAWVGIPFGFLLGDHHDAPVLIIRTAIGNRGLAWDFRPPSSGALPDVQEDVKRWEGVEYFMMVEGVRATLRNLAKILPGYRDEGYELAGFVWFQGHKDTGNEDWATSYEQNLVHLIRDVRQAFEAPELPVMVATVGFGGPAMSGHTKTVWQAQMAVGDPARHPEFAGTVKTVDTRPFWREKDVSPSGQGYHYNRNAETYMLIGEALGRGMIGLHESRK